MTAISRLQIPGIPDAVQRALRWHGASCLAYASIQPGMDYHSLPGERAYIAHRIVPSPCGRAPYITVALGDPIGSDANRIECIRTFLDNHPATVFVQVGSRIARFLRCMEFEIAPLGLECFTSRNDRNTLVDPRRNARVAWSHGVRTSIEAISRNLRAELRLVSDDWLRRRGNREIRFLVRPWITNHESDVQHFVARLNGVVVGFLFMDPIYGGDVVIARYHSIARFAARAPRGTMDLLTLAALQHAFEGGAQYVAFGLVPFADSRSFEHLQHLSSLHLEEFSASLTNALRRAREVVEKYYSIAGNARFKKKYASGANSVYVAVRGCSTQDALYALANVTRIVPWPLVSKLVQQDVLT